MYPDLHQFVDALTRRGELKRISAGVDPVLDIAQQTDAESKSAAPNPGSAASRRNDPEFAHLGGSALLYESPVDADFPVLINAFGSYRRMEMALGDRSLDEIARTIGELVKPEPPRSPKRGSLRRCSRSDPSG